MWGLHRKQINQGCSGGNWLCSDFVFVVFPPSCEPGGSHPWLYLNYLPVYFIPRMLIWFFGIPRSRCHKIPLKRRSLMIFFPCFPFIFFNMRLWWVFEVQIWLQEFNPSQLWWTQLFWPMVSLFLTHSWKGKKKREKWEKQQKRRKNVVWRF